MYIYRNILYFQTYIVKRCILKFIHVEVKVELCISIRISNAKCTFQRCKKHINIAKSRNFWF
jgi:hypothetical protein